MPAVSALTLSDRQATPINHIFNPAGSTGDLTSWVETASGAVVGRNQLSVSVVTPKNNTGTAANKVRIKMTMPRVISGTDASGRPYQEVLSRPIVDAVFNITNDMTLSDRKVLIGLFTSALLSPSIMEAVEQVTPFY